MALLCHSKQPYACVHIFKKSLLSLSTVAHPGGKLEHQKPTGIPFEVAKHGTFFQAKPHLQNTYLGDSLLQNYLKRNIPKEMMPSIDADLSQFGNRCATDLQKLSLECEQQPPELITQDAWGARRNVLQTCAAWKEMHTVSAQEGLVAIGYERKFAEWSRLYQISKLYLYAPSSGLYSCPLAMTDGAARTIQALKLKDPVFTNAYRHLTSRDPDHFWTSGQWMTEKRGGSDVSNGTETVAVPHGDSTYHLYGYKWFTSALDSNISLTLARTLDANNQPSKSGLTMFYLETKDDNGDWNGIQTVRLKDKLGTRQLPTAELLLTGSLAYQMSEEGRGVAGISHMLTITRIHNALSSVAAMRRILSLSRDYSHKRSAFGQVICKHPLHMQTLARMEVETRASLLLVLEVGKLLGREECGLASDEEKLLLRILTPILKLYTAKQAMSVVSEGLESFGGQGYMEDTGLPAILRDAQVLPIWEGTTNVLSLDVLRCIAKTQGQVLLALHSNTLSRLDSSKGHSELQDARSAVLKALKGIGDFVQGSPEKMLVAARDLSFSIARTYIGALTIEYAAHPQATKQDIITAKRWCSTQDLCPLSINNNNKTYDVDSVSDDYVYVMDGYH